MYNYPYYRQPQNGGTSMPMHAAPMFPTPQIGTTLPTGLPGGPTMSPLPVPSVPSGATQTLQDTAFLPGFLRTQIGKNMRVQFLIGTTGPLVDRVGRLLAVGTNYILMKPIDTDDLLTGDLYAIKFVDIFQ